ncbi:transcription factor IIIB 90 kDa subunit [Drosophila biarmipes]|uniref:transcription factor IIIB 90 kDa subunit n=1 Tax=Drosophila biarmipes TaxID=125945 RepID=UPI0007E5EA26|nr:transcription factor IIIB 90 kDa subunit [Drosophila biarmipes]XP_043947093.1 transcription factor IIIB 90 kDa subunit [Drosophila biarmipes]
MSTGLKCRNCGSNEIEEDNARGDRVCMNCGSVLEDSLIVSEVQFEEVGHGAAAIGQFVSAESSGGATNYGYGKFQVGSGTESREVTIKKAKKDITLLCQQLQLSQHYADTALNFFKMALSRHLTRGRKSTHIYAACVYMTCRTEGTSHLLIDISDVQQICSYELGRTYLKLSHALCINIPSVDPCLYIMRFANRLQLGAKTHEVSMTALRIVQRMKKDCMHSGRRPTGLCGAALLIAARMHDFSRTMLDVIGVVKIHESTLRKRLSEFAETPSGGLTLEEFMTVDLEREQDPPSFKAARKKDRERIKDMGEHELTELQKEIDAHLEKDLGKYSNSVYRHLTKGKGITPLSSPSTPNSTSEKDLELEESRQFIEQSNAEVINELIAKNEDVRKTEPGGLVAGIEGLRPDIEAICRVTQSDLEDVEKAKQPQEQELITDDLNDDELDQYVLTEEEAVAKLEMWKNLNAEYLREQKERDERLAKEREEGKPERKKRKPRKKVIGPSSTAGEAIEKMLQEKKISSKIDYEVLKTLTSGSAGLMDDSPATSADTKPSTLEDIKQQPAIVEEGPIAPKSRASRPAYDLPGPSRKRPKVEMGLPVSQAADEEQPDTKPAVVVEADDLDEDAEAEEVDAEPEAEPEATLQDMLNTGGDDDEFGYGFDEEEEY